MLAEGYRYEIHQYVCIFFPAVFSCIGKKQNWQDIRFNQSCGFVEQKQYERGRGAKSVCREVIMINYKV